MAVFTKILEEAGETVVVIPDMWMVIVSTRCP
jgi:hypothetical protein